MGQVRSQVGKRSSLREEPRQHLNLVHQRQQSARQPPPGAVTRFRSEQQRIAQALAEGHHHTRVVERTFLAQTLGDHREDLLLRLPIDPAQPAVLLEASERHTVEQIAAAEVVEESVHRVPRPGRSLALGEAEQPLSWLDEETLRELEQLAERSLVGGADGVVLGAEVCPEGGRGAAGVARDLFGGEGTTAAKTVLHRLDECGPGPATPRGLGLKWHRAITLDDLRRLRGIGGCLEFLELESRNMSVLAIESEVLEIARRRAADGENLRHLHSEVVSALVDSGAFRLWVAQRYGGAEIPVADALRTIETISHADGSTGWCVMIANTTALTSFRLPAEWGQAIYADPRACTGGFGMPSGSARRAGEDLEVTGQWSWGSGTDHCTWIGGGVKVIDDAGEPSTTCDGAAAPFVFFDPRDVELLDTWHVAGLRATASTDYRVERVRVPRGRWVQLVGGQPTVDAPLGRFPFFGALAAGVSAVLLGLAQRATDELIALGEKRAAGSSKTLAERACVQSDLALALANIGQARSFLYEMVELATESVEREPSVDGATRARLRLAVTAAARRAVEAVDLCYHAAGGTAVYENNALQRVFRDAHVAIAHGMVAARTLEPLGRHAFGLPTSTALF